LAQFERGLIRGRTQAGLAAAREKGRIGGRPSTTKSDRKVQLALEMTTKEMKIKDINSTLGLILIAVTHRDIFAFYVHNLLMLVVLHAVYPVASRFHIRLHHDGVILT
jgi:hypothetical protein